VHGLGKTFEVAAARELFRKYQKVLEALDAAVMRPEFQVPEVKSGRDETPYLTLWRDVAYLQSSHVRLAEASVGPEAAMAEAMKLLRFGHAIEGAQGPVIDFLVGVAIEAIALQHVAAIAARSDLEPRSLMKLAEALRRFGSNRRGLQDALRADYAILCDSFARITAKDFEALEWEDTLVNRLLLSPPFFKEHQTRRLLGEEVRALCIDAAAPRAARRVVDIESAYGTKKRLSWFLSNSAGKSVLHAVIPTLERGIAQADLHDWAVAAVRTLLCLKAFRRGQGRLPDTLDELVPEFLAEVPVDPFDGAPLHYSRSKELLFSRGLNSAGAEPPAEDAEEQLWLDLDGSVLRLEP
jgi:hypothetical protein